MKNKTMEENQKLKTREEIIKTSEEAKKQGKVVVSINGSFDILHAGHVRMLQEAKEQGDVLIVGLNTDDSVKRTKKHWGSKSWDKRPIIPQDDRAKMLTALECVDYVTLFDETHCFDFVESVKPNIHVNGSDYGKDCIEAPYVKKHGGVIHIAKWTPGISTTELINKIIEVYEIDKGIKK